MNEADPPNTQSSQNPVKLADPQSGVTSVPLETWRHPVSEVVRRGQTVEREATAEERTVLAAALAIPDVRRLSARYRLTALGGERYGLAGALVADLIQTCVVTLDPIDVRLELPLEAEFRHDHDRPPETAGDSEAEILKLPDYEPIEDSYLAVGRVAFETLAAGLDPYPRKVGSEFDWTDEEGARATSPFAALAKLKRDP